MLGADYREIIDLLRPHGIAADAQGEAYLIGWDVESDAPEAWIAANHDGYGRPAFDPHLTHGFTNDVSSCSPRIQALATAAQTPFDTSGVFDPHRDGHELIAAQSEVPGSLSGGLCHLTTITRDTIRMEILRSRHAEG